MCGLAGILSLAPHTAVEEHELRLMAGPLVHRGPDDEGYYLDPQRRCGLGFRRLSIIDLAGGHQPISNEDGTVWLILNGEIYNFRELRSDLAARGHAFRTHADSEVVVHLYEERGADCFAELAGMFAIAIWDERGGTLHLARDRLGKKPLAYAIHNGRLYFASEPKAILAAADIPRRIDPVALQRYLVFQYVPAPGSIFHGLHKLPPGHRLSLPAGVEALPGPLAYWTLPPAGSFAGTYEEARNRLGELLTAAVRRRLIADVPLGAFLSGGVDSSIVVALMRRLGVQPLRTYTVGFSDPRYDESGPARLVARRLACEHHEQIVTARAREVLDALVWHYDEPLADSSAIPTYYVSRHARQHVAVALTGDGGDECFAGYDRYAALRLASRFDALPAFVRQAVARLAALLPRGRARSTAHRAYRFLSALGGTPAGRYLTWVNVFEPAALAEGFTEDFRRAIDPDEPRRWFEELFARFNGDAVRAANGADILSYLPFDVLAKVDIASMACSLECRCPMLDHKLLEFAWSLPTDWRIGPRGGKRILKDWARTSGLLERDVLERPKMGFGVPVGEWMRRELRGFIEHRLLAPNALSLRVFRRDWLKRLVDSHLRGGENHEHRLWALLILELWAARWKPQGP